MKTDINRVKAAINKNIVALKDTYDVKNIGIFGSVSTGQNTAESDVDVLVDFSQAPGFFKFIELEEFLSRIIGKKVDLVTKKALKPAIKQQILQEVDYV